MQADEAPNLMFNLWALNLSCGRNAGFASIITEEQLAYSLQLQSSFSLWEAGKNHNLSSCHHVLTHSAKWVRELWRHQCAVTETTHQSNGALSRSHNPLFEDTVLNYVNTSRGINPDTWWPLSILCFVFHNCIIWSFVLCI